MILRCHVSVLFLSWKKLRISFSKTKWMLYHDREQTAFNRDERSQLSAISMALSDTYWYNFMSINLSPCPTFLVVHHHLWLRVNRTPSAVPCGRALVSEFVPSSCCLQQECNRLISNLWSSRSVGEFWLLVQSQSQSCFCSIEINK